MLNHDDTDPQTQHEVLKWYDVTTKQNYFTNNNDIIQYDGLAMRAPFTRLAEFDRGHPVV